MIRMGHVKMTRIRVTIKIRRKVGLNKEGITQIRVVASWRKQLQKKTTSIQLLILDPQRKRSQFEKAPSQEFHSMSTAMHRKTRWPKVYRLSKVHQTISLKKSFKKYTES